MAIYAKMRAADNERPRLGTSMVDLLGAPNENDPDTLQLVQTWFQNVVDAASVTGPGGILIHCSDDYLQPTETTGKYLEPNGLVTPPQPQAGAITTKNACGGWIKGFTYSLNGQQVIVLCSDSDRGALKSYLKATLDNFRKLGDFKKAPLVQLLGLDVLGGYLSTTILHELMHAASFAEQLKILQPGQFPGILPDKVNGQPIGEIYQYGPISGKVLGKPESIGQPTANNLQHNADSFALLAASWYLPPYGWEYGVIKAIGKARRAPDEYPDTPIPPGPS
ncbi:hypothetical protein OIDMADRAFT_30799 [Oidiodendron maius Zn]|uniref:Lysine-specific metallo-endopeptidase domain-containing protein n=1 Tax=Oidiodendron maius (strain Zn) TaxID=913774 RepID=A0A0C3CJS1_OIDMZ|nr:hypothetical protein OIDMADRAFT_30799 [Oidiodendron maius Zn]